MNKLSMEMVALGAACLMAGCASDPKFNGPKPGETWYVSTERAVVRESPNELSPAVKALVYKDAVAVEKDVRVSPPFSGDRELFPEDLIPGWVQLKDGGYLAVPGLASEWLISNQNPDEEISADGMTAAKRGFSESENDAELASMRGAAGAGKAAAKADPAAVARVLAAYKPLSDAERSEFIRAGELKTHPVNPEVLQIEGPSTGSSLLTGAQKFGATGLGMVADKVGESEGDGAKLVSSAGKTVSGLIYSEIGPVQEFQLGRAVAARVLPLYPVLSQNDPRSVYVNKLGHVIVAASNDPMPYHGYNFVVLDTEEVNAFAVPGGFVFVTTGMLKFLNDEDELAAILGHEMGHIELRHGMRAVGTEKVLKLFSMLKELGTSKGQGGEGALAAEVKQMVDEVFEKMFTSVRNGYGIETESQADWRSVQLSQALGYDTMALYEVLERFKAEKGTYGGASYPAERGKDVLKYRQQLGCPDGQTAGRSVRAARYKTAVGK